MTSLQDELRAHAANQIEDNLRYIVEADRLMKLAAGTIDYLILERDLWRQQATNERERCAAAANPPGKTYGNSNGDLSYLNGYVNGRADAEKAIWEPRVDDTKGGYEVMR